MPPLKKKSPAMVKALDRKRKQLTKTEPEKTKIRQVNAESQKIRRQNDEVRFNINLLNSQSQKRRLAGTEEHDQHKHRLKVAQKIRLADPVNHDEHKDRLKETQRKRLADSKNRDEHKDRLKEAQRKRLADSKKHDEHKDRLKEAQRKRLADSKNREEHKNRLKEAQRKRLADPKNLEKHRAIASENQKRRLADPKNLEKHRVRALKNQKRRLADPKNLEKHRERLILAQKRRLADPENQEKHKERLIVAQKRRLADPENHEKHRAKLTVAQRRRLADPENREKHRARLLLAQKIRLANPISLNKHKRINSRAQKRRWKKRVQNMTDHRMRIKSRISNYKKKILCEKEKRRTCCNRVRKSIIKKNNSLRSKLLLEYQKLIKTGPNYTCSCCGRLCFKHSIKFFKTNVKQDKAAIIKFRDNLCKPEVTQGFGTRGVCGTCDSYLKKLKVPPLSLAAHADLCFPVVPNSVKNLTSLEERFISPRIPFMQIRVSHIDQQFSIQGRVVNVPSDVISNVNILPRMFSETAIIPIALKKKKSFKSIVQEEPIRPNAIAEALKDLKNCPAFQEADVTIDRKRIPILRNVAIFNSDEVDQTIEGIAKNDAMDICVSDFEEDDPEPVNIPIDSTLLISNHNPDALVFTPGEGFTPLPLFLDTYAEALSFMRIYGGWLRPRPDHVSYQKLVNSELLRYDRRCASEPSKLFYCATKLRGMKISASILLCLKKLKGKQQCPTAGFCLSEDLIRSFHIHDSGYRLFLPDRGSPAFWGQKQSELFAMIRQLGPPTLFLTLSPAETQWPELLVLLKKVLDNEEINEEVALALNYREKVRLISSDPVTCARYFDFRIKNMIKLFTTKHYGVFYEHEVVDFYYRVEFQQRGSPHIHSLLWLKNAPDLEKNGIQSCEKFIDKFISCSAEKLSEDILTFQTHKHTFSCKKKDPKTKKSYCRFGIPLYPMAETKILKPLVKDEVSDEKKKELNQNINKIKDYLDDIYKDLRKKCLLKDNSFQSFLNHLNISNEDYVLSIRNSLKRPTVFLKRLPNDIRTNAYNVDILKLHRASMDIQFITDTYSVAVYVLNYINKTKRGISRVLREANEEVAKGDLSIKEKLKFMANKFLDSSEFSAQEAVYYVLPLPLSRCTRTVEFINTGPPERRVSILLSKTELQKLPADSTDVFAKSNIDHYVNRPDVLKDVCLADFVARYNYKKIVNPSRLTNLSKIREQPNLDSENDETETESTNVLKLKNEDGFVFKRKKSKIIRFVRFNIETHEDDFYREQLMLFLPWVDEESELISVDHKEKFNKNVKVIIQNRKQYIFECPNEEATTDFIDEAIKEHNENETLNLEVEEDTVDPIPGDGYEVLRDRTDEGDIFYDGGFGLGNEKNEDEFVPVPHVLPEERYLQVVRSLNDKQQRYHYHVLHNLKTNAGPIYECVLGSAGVGKSRLIEALEQSLVRFFNSTAGVELNALRVLLCAPTGKAAFNIRGVTLHSTFALPLNQASYDMPPLSSSVSNTLFCKLKDVKLIIMDEVSMIGTKMFARVDARLKQIFRTNIPFAGISVILFGDFNQLAPVGDGYIFSNNTANPYSHLIDNPLWEIFSFYKLTEIMRQKDDAPFAIALNNLAMGCLTSDEVKMFKSRVKKKDIPNSNSLRLFRTNEEVDTYNKSVFCSRKEIEIREFEAIDRVIGKVSDAQRISTLDYMKKSMKTSNTYGLPIHIKLCVGIRYMVTVNVKTTDGLVNGAVGILKFVETVENDKVIRLWLLFDDEKVGRETRRGARSAATRLGIDNMLTPLELVSRNIRPRQNSPIMVMRRQFPLVPAEAITIYKSQGGTYDSVVVTLRKGMRRTEMYVAFSRSTSLNGLTILGTFKPPGPRDVNNIVVKEIDKGLTEKPVKIKLHFLQDYPKLFSIIFHNVTSLRKHFSDIKSDRCFTSAKIIVLVETWLKPNETMELPGYEVVYRSDVKQSLPHAYGMMIYSKKDIAKKLELVYDFNEEKKGLACNIALMKLQNKLICGVYKPPSTPMRMLICLLEEAFSSIMTTINDSILILGDFNEDIMNNEHNHPLLNFFEGRGLKNLLPFQPSTNLLTQIDLCVSNNTDFFACYYDSYFSYHKPILCIEHFKEIFPTSMIDNEGNNNKNIAFEQKVLASTKNNPDNEEQCIQNVDHYDQPFEDSSKVERIIEEPTTEEIISIHDAQEISNIEAYILAKESLMKEIEENVLPNDSWINDRPLHEILELIKNTTDFETLPCVMLQCPEVVQPATTDREILILGGLATTNHFHCTYYDGQTLRIYDSLSSYLPEDEKVLIHRRYPNLTENDIVFEKCQQQPDLMACGVFSAANAVSLALGLNPSDLKYKLDKQKGRKQYATLTMRRHMFKIIQEQRLIPFEGSSMVEKRFEEPMMTQEVISIHDSQEISNFEAYILAKESLMKEIEENVLPNDSWINDRPLDEILKLIKNTTDFETLPCVMLQCPEVVQPATTDQEILILGGLATTNHFHCTYYDGQTLRIYDSLSSYLPEDEKVLIHRRYPNLTENDIVFEKCQQQPDLMACGVFSAANAVSLALGLNPSDLKYKLDKQQGRKQYATLTMRQHMFKIIQEQRLIPFESS